MAAPAQMTGSNVSGKFGLNKSLSQKYDDILKVQGVGWAARKAAGMATPHLAIKHYTDADGLEHLEIEQNVPGVRTGNEHRRLDGSKKSQQLPLVGAALVSNDRTALGQLTHAWLRDGWLEESLVDGKIIHVVAQGEGDDGFRMEHTWGFQMIDGAKRYVRRIHLTGAKGEVVEACLVYDYEGPL